MVPNSIYQACRTYEECFIKNRNTVAIIRFEGETHVFPEPKENSVVGNDSTIYVQPEVLLYSCRLKQYLSKTENVIFMRSSNVNKLVVEAAAQKRKLSIPIYLLSNTLDRSPEGRVLALEGNHLYCDCNSAKVLKFWLARQKHIENNDKMLCENIKSKVSDLSETKLCQSLQDWTDYIYYLITAEIFLLLALVMKVSYDYWIFKTAGYLPWPASKMPKLSCDWLCES